MVFIRQILNDCLTMQLDFIDAMKKKVLVYKNWIVMHMRALASAQAKYRKNACTRFFSAINQTFSQGRHRLSVSSHQLDLRFFSSRLRFSSTAFLIHSEGF
jgi:hypothetical protein